MATGLERIHRRPPDGFVQGVPGADFEEERQIAVFAGQGRGVEGVRETVEGGIAVAAGGAALDHFGEEPGVVVGAEEVAGVQVAFAPGLVRAPGKLPVVEAGAEAAGDGLRVVRRARRDRGRNRARHRASGSIQPSPSFWARKSSMPCSRSPPAASIFASRSWKAMRVRTGVAEFGVFVPIDAPEALGLSAAGVGAGMVAFREDMPQLRHGESHDGGHDGIDHDGDAKSFAGCGVRGGLDARRRARVAATRRRSGCRKV